MWGVDFDGLVIFCRGIAPPEKCLNRDDFSEEKISYFCHFNYSYIDTEMLLIKIVMADIIGIPLYELTSLSWILQTLQPLLLPLLMKLPLSAALQTKSV